MATLTQLLSAINADIKHLKKVRKDAIARIKELEQKKRQIKADHKTWVGIVNKKPEYVEGPDAAPPSFNRTARTALMNYEGAISGRFDGEKMAADLAAIKHLETRKRKIKRDAGEPAKIDNWPPGKVNEVSEINITRVYLGQRDCKLLEAQLLQLAHRLQQASRNRFADVAAREEAQLTYRLIMTLAPKIGTSTDLLIGKIGDWK